MTTSLTQFAEAIGERITITYFPNQGTRWMCHFRNGEVRDGGCLVGAHGNGPTPRHSMIDYAQQIAGRTLVFDSFAENRRIVVAPRDLVGEDE